MAKPECIMTDFFLDTGGTGGVNFLTHEGVKVSIPLSALKLLLKIPNVDFFKISPNGKTVFDNLIDFISQLILNVLNDEEDKGARKHDIHRHLKSTEEFHFKNITGKKTTHSLRIEISNQFLKEIMPMGVDEKDFIGEFLRKNVFMVVGYHKEEDNIIVDLIAHCRQLSHHIFKFMPSNKIQDSLGAPGMKTLRETKERVDLRFRLGRRDNDFSQDRGRRSRSRSPPRNNGGRRSRSRSPPRHDRERSHRQQDLHSHIGGGYPSDLGGPAAVPPGYIRVDQVPAYMAQFAAPQPPPPPNPVYYPWGAPPAPGV